MIKLKRILFRTAAAILAAVLFVPLPVYGISAKSAILMDPLTGQVLYEKNCSERSLIASTTKIMTALIVCERCNVLESMRIPREAVGIEGSSMYLRENELLTLQELLYGLMLASGNDAAAALAIYCGGTIQDFADLMNEKARQLGMTGTHFVNPHGLDAPDHYSTAKDLAILAGYAMNHPVFARTVSAKTAVIGERYLRNHNKLLWLVEGAEGVKTGFTRAAGRILVSSARRNSRRLIAVTINDPDDWSDHAALYRIGFEYYSQQRIVTAGDYIGQMEVIGGTSDTVPVYAGENFVFSAAAAERISVQLDHRLFVYAPVTSGAAAGRAYVLVNGKPVGTVSAVYGQTVEQYQKEKSIWRRD